MARYAACVSAGLVLGVLIPVAAGVLLIEFTDFIDKDFRQ